MRYSMLIIIVILVMILYFFRPILNIFYLCIRYGANYLDDYLTANITKFKICRYTARRGHKIKFWLPHYYRYVEGEIIGLTPDKKLYVRETNGGITWYKSTLMKDNDLIYLK